MLSKEQVEFFNANGYLVVEDAVTLDQLDALRQDFAGWVEESRGHDEAWGEIINGKPRFDVEKGHCAATPALRRVNAPHEVSDAYFNVELISALMAKPPASPVRLALNWPSFYATNCI